MYQCFLKHVQNRGSGSPTKISFWLMRISKRHQTPRLGQTLAKWDGSPQVKHLLPEIGSPVAVTNVPLEELDPLRPLPRGPRPPFRPRVDVGTLFERAEPLPPVPLLMLSSHL